MSHSKQFKRFAIILSIILNLPVHSMSSGHIYVYAIDSSTGISSPPNSDVYLNTAIQEPLGLNHWLLLSDIDEGMHTVEVTTSHPGYCLRQSPDNPNAVSDPDSAYGNPRNIEVSDNQSSITSFMFDPIITTEAVIRDRWTMERLNNTSVEFVVSSGVNTGLSYAQYPWEATYASNWISDASGMFPTNTTLYLDDYNLHLTKSGYQIFSTNNIITGASAGDHYNFGTLFLTPIDANTNQIADSWEAVYFGAGNSVDAFTDADFDGMNNRDEYIAGTDPTNWSSHLWIEPITESTNFYLAWYTQPDRTYIISGTTNLLSDTWVQVGGPWEATNGQFEIIWEDTNHNLSWHNNYRTEIVPSGWQGTNSILVRTNDWPVGGRGTTNIWGGGLPPLP